MIFHRDPKNLLLLLFILVAESSTLALLFTVLPSPLLVLPALGCDSTLTTLDRMDEYDWMSHKQSHTMSTGAAIVIVMGMENWSLSNIVAVVARQDNSSRLRWTLRGYCNNIYHHLAALFIYTIIIRE